MRRRRMLEAALAVTLLPSCLSRRADRSRSADALDAFVRAEMRRTHMPGLAIGVARDGEVRSVRGYGYADVAARRPVDERTEFHLASVTKTVTATSIMQLVEAGRMTLDEPVAPHLDFPLIDPHHADVPITARHLLTHTSGLSDAKYYEIDFRERGRDATLPLDAFLKAYLVPGGRHYSAEQCFSGTAPGTTWDYSNVGFALLGYLAGRVGGEDMREQSARRIFAPLRMRDTHWTLAATPASRSAVPYDVVDGAPTATEPVGFPDWPAGMLRASMADFMRFVAASANGGAASGVRLLRADTLAQMLDMRTPAGLPGWLTGQGLGWMASTLGGRATPNHWGGDPGVFTAVYLRPEVRTGVALFSNLTASDDGKAAIKAIAMRLFDAYAPS
ncbi:MAG TPA: serine hydrolase domain-containing protein [Dokdonella sp.]